MALAALIAIALAACGSDSSTQPTPPTTTPTTAATPTPTTAATPTPTAAATPAHDVIVRALPESPVLEAPSGPFTAISVGYHYGGHDACALTEAGEAICWERYFEGEALTLPGRFATIVSVEGTTCGATDAGELVCLGRQDLVADAPAGRYVTLGGIDGYVCGLTEGHELVCWGRYRKQPGARPNLDSDTPSPYLPYGPLHDPPAGRYVTVMVTTTSFLDTTVLTGCAEKARGGWVCWQSRGVYWFTGDEEERTREVEGDPRDAIWVRGLSDASFSGQLRVMTAPDPSPGRLQAASSRHDYACALTEAGEPVCWEAVPNVLPPPDPPPGRYAAVSDGRNHTCALTEAGQAVCWGWNNWGQLDLPPGRYTAISAGDFHTCALTEAGEAVCEGNIWPRPPTGRYTAIATGADTDYGGAACALVEGGEVACWGGRGGDAVVQRKTPGRELQTISMGDREFCGLAEVGEAVCWEGSRLAPRILAGRYRAVDVGSSATCALTDAGEVVCWGADAPPGSFTALAVGLRHACALDDAGEAVCWGWTAVRSKSDDPWVAPYQEAAMNPPPGPFTAISASEFRTCALTESAEVVCWGDVEYEQMPLSLSIE